MEPQEEAVGARLARHLRDLRHERDLTLEDLASRSGVSRATLSRIENAETSPTAETLGRLASAYSLPISQLLSPLGQSFQPLVRRAEQSLWEDPGRSLVRRSISPPSGQLNIELIEVELGANECVQYAAPAMPGQEHHVYVLSGSMAITVEGSNHELTEGDCLRYLLFGETRFTTSASPCTYVIALS